MREIKFRGRDGDDWYYGSLFVNECGHTVISAPKSFWMKPVNADTVGQYTGLKDCKGREIYEGDVLSLREGSDEMIKVIDFYAAITALDLSAMMNLRLLDYYFERGEVHVIGNVHDNPELLEVEA